jgi:ElaB/YqjD/DUF883 family membrane-anchored ribosome-binding protein
MTNHESAGASPGRAQAEADAEHLARDIGALREDVARLSDSVASLVRIRAEEGAARVKDVMDATGATVNEVAGSFARAGNGIAADANVRLGILGTELRASIYKSPLACMALAAGVGMLFGALRRR